ncbi:uncharacterized protein N7515_003828 [Penicillium bovifimosum]|uniref:Uncharacterized protein n=1 Tax=Penicillium bovifimosum TaxID=126998 RepID=A0A9W9H5D0_9EURO|nr:uncharacterized protein N7515_003828 [Penicillium bovifimosum]KAJ5138980.1 hypothetical protein N7515_003828 [Penicillium bovifimosum]
MMIMIRRWSSPMLRENQVHPLKLGSDVPKKTRNHFDNMSELAREARAVLASMENDRFGARYPR